MKLKEIKKKLISQGKMFLKENKLILTRFQIPKIEVMILQINTKNGFPYKKNLKYLWLILYFAILWLILPV